VELAGMVAHYDFAEKVSTNDAGARQTPDLLIRLPGDATIVVDSKVPITAFRSGVAAADAGARQGALDGHAKQVRDHIKALGAKAYWKTFQPGPDFVVMFVPLDSLMTAAFEHDNALFELAIANHVVIATPMTLLALLKAAAAGWSQQRLAENTEEIQRIGRELYDRLRTLVEHAERMGANIRQAADNYNNFIGALEQKVLPGARRFKELGVASTKDLAELDPLQLDMRTVVKPELTGRRDPDLLTEH
jgi:DNA recombination protein RmuC